MNALVAAGALTSLDALPPCAETVVALAECRGRLRTDLLRQLLLRDPGALLAHLCLPATATHLWPADGAAASTAQALLQLFLHCRHDRWADWHSPRPRAAYRFSLAIGRIAHGLATPARVNPEQAQVAGVLAALGWLAQLQSPEGETADTVLRSRGILRRLHLPGWLAQVLLHLDLPPDPSPGQRLTLVVQAAAALAHEHWPQAPSPCRVRPQAALRLLGLDDDVRQVSRRLLEQDEAPPASATADLVGRSLRLGMIGTQPEDSQLVSNLENELETVRQRLADCLQQEQLRLEQMKLASVAEFAAGAAHEINTPLAIISGQAQHLLRGEEDRDRMRTLERIVSQAQRIHVLLRDLLTFARPPQPKFKRLETTQFVGKVVAGLRDHAVQKQVRLEAAKSARRNYVRGDNELLDQAVTALVRNALDAATTGGWVRVSVRQDVDAAVVIAIEDDGPGLTGPQREHLFDPFYSGRGAGRGAGLGLSKSWRIAQLHGGTIELPPEGSSPTRFVIRLPAAPAAARRKPPRPRPQRSAARRK